MRPFHCGVYCTVALLAVALVTTFQSAEDKTQHQAYRQVGRKKATITVRYSIGWQGCHYCTLVTLEGRFIEIFMALIHHKTSDSSIDTLTHISLKYLSHLFVKLL
jgi:hypothetical protein